MSNDDVATPTKLVGKKIAPILEMPQDNLIMAESLDICSFFENNPRFGPQIIAPFTGRSDLKQWQLRMTDPMRTLIRPRYMLSYLPEFMQQDAKVKACPLFVH